MKKLTSVFLALALTLALAVPALAGSGTVDTAITYRSIKIVIDGKTINPVDSEGNAVEPFIMDGSTYLPLRAIAGALGLDVGWDDGSSTVAMVSGGEVKSGAGTPAGTKGEKAATLSYRNIRLVINGVEVVPKDSDGVVVEPFIYEGSTYLPLRAIAGALALDVGWDAPTSTVILTSKESGDKTYTGGRWLMTGEKQITPEGEGSTYYEFLADGRPQCAYRSGFEAANGKVAFQTSVYLQIQRASYSNGATFTYKCDSDGKLQEARCYDTNVTSAEAPCLVYKWMHGGFDTVTQDSWSAIAGDGTYSRLRATHRFDKEHLCVTEGLFAETEQGSVSLGTVSYERERDSAGRITGMDCYLTDAAGKKTLVETHTLSYNDAAREITWKTVDESGDAPETTLRTVAYDEYGNIVRVTENDIVYTYTYAYFPGTIDLHLNTVVEEGVNINANAQDCAIRTIIGHSPYKK